MIGNKKREAQGAVQVVQDPVQAALELQEIAEATFEHIARIEEITARKEQAEVKKEEHTKAQSERKTMARQTNVSQ